jgi:hypothetical protein
MLCYYKNENVQNVLSFSVMCFLSFSNIQKSLSLSSSEESVFSSSDAILGVG